MNLKVFLYLIMQEIRLLILDFIYINYFFPLYMLVLLYIIINIIQYLVENFFVI